MDMIDGLKVFVATAQTGSFTSAGQHLGISNRLTSKYVAELEQRLDTRLFQRTTRRVGLTPAGEDLLARAPALLDEFDDLLAEMKDQSRGFSGVLRISAPVTFGEVYVAGMLGRFAEANPNLTIDLRLDDRFTDLASEGIDLAFRIGTSDMLSVKVRKLGEMRAFAVASPDYLARAGTPNCPADLTGHVTIVDSNRRKPRRWVFRKDGAEETVDLNGQLIVNSARAAAELAAHGRGIAYSPSFAVSDHLKSGRLVALLAGFSTESSTVSAVYLEGRTMPRVTRALIDFAVADVKLADVLSESGYI